jgi:hypothetical protein
MIVFFSFWSSVQVWQNDTFLGLKIGIYSDLVWYRMAGFVNIITIMVIMGDDGI